MKGHRQPGSQLGGRHWRVFAGLAGLLLIVLFTLFRPIHPGGLTERVLQSTQAGSTLVVYVYQNTEDEDQQANFNYFLRHGMDAEDGNSYVVIARELAQGDVDRLPSNARLIRMPAICFWGMLGTLFESGALSQDLLRSFTYITVASSFMRGPFLPVALQESRLPWTLGLTRKLQAPVQLVAPTISCSRIHGIGPPSLDGVHDSVPHVSWQAFAMTQEGLQLMLKDGEVFKCHNPHKMGAAEFSAARASLAVLLNGGNLDSLLIRYQGVDWTEPQTWGCNGRHPPGGESAYDGTTLHPLEVMFTEVTKFKLYSGLTSARAAKRFDLWQHAQAQGRTNVTVNIFALDSTPFHKEKITYMKARGPGCFDAAYYAAQSHDLQVSGMEAPALWEHFAANGQFEDRPFRFSCVYLKGRGPGCFDTDFYHAENVDLHDKQVAGQGFDEGQAWHHFVTAGQFEGRHYKFKDACGEDIDSPNHL